MTIQFLSNRGAMAQLSAVVLLPHLNTALSEIVHLHSKQYLGLPKNAGVPNKNYSGSGVRKWGDIGRERKTKR
ncbi:MAG: hypothetical protein ACYCY7_03555 [Gallionella sp.]